MTYSSRGSSLHPPAILEVEMALGARLLNPKLVLTFCFSFLQYFADVRILDVKGRSALWHAKCAGSKECADILRHNGCNDLGTMIPQGSDVFC